MRAIGIAVVTVCAWLGPRTAAACKCATPPLDGESIAQYDVIFEGTASRVSSSPRYEVQNTRFEVQRVWRGEIGARIKVVSDERCGDSFDRGKRYVVFARGDGANGWLRVENCSLTRRLEVAGEALALLGDPMPRSEARCDAGDRRDAWIIVVPLLLARRRRRCV